MANSKEEMGFAALNPSYRNLALQAAKGRPGSRIKNFRDDVRIKDFRDDARIGRWTLERPSPCVPTLERGNKNYWMFLLDQTSRISGKLPRRPPTSDL
ncbi:MAG: hypothetical protein C4576_35880 [Desulfobacteraceae bacterium]|nr:MAG: hypothetical protein C4576_35880 [Desulfobacteraceae bacterium]